MSKPRAIIFALLAAAFYAISAPLSKLLLAHIGETTMAALLYLGAGVGIGILSLFNRKDSKSSEKLGRSFCVRRASPWSSSCSGSSG